MGSRYLVSGCQLGLIKGLIQVNNKKAKTNAIEEIEKIINEQYVGNSDGDEVGSDSKQLLFTKSFNK